MTNMAGVPMVVLLVAIVENGKGKELNCLTVFFGQMMGRH